MHRRCQRCHHRRSNPLQEVHGHVRREGAPPQSNPRERLLRKTDRVVRSQERWRDSQSRSRHRWGGVRTSAEEGRHWDRVGKVVKAARCWLSDEDSVASSLLGNARYRPRETECPVGVLSNLPAKEPRQSYTTAETVLKICRGRLRRRSQRCARAMKEIKSN
jgi:hypothetical protein